LYKIQNKRSIVLLLSTFYFQSLLNKWSFHSFGIISVKDDGMILDSRKLAGVAILGALVVVFDYALKFSGLKIPFPLFQDVKFDFTGIPVVICYLLYGLFPGATTSAVVFFAILVRSGNFIGASMKAIAEFATIFGISIGSLFDKSSERINKTFQIVFSVILRVVVMFLVNLVVLTIAYGYTFDVSLGLSPLIAIFNVFQGLLSLIVGFLILELLKRRVPSLVT